MTASTFRAFALRPLKASETLHVNLEARWTICAESRAWIPRLLATLTWRICMDGWWDPPACAVAAEILATPSGAHCLDHLDEIAAARHLVAPRPLELRPPPLQRIATL